MDNQKDMSSMTVKELRVLGKQYKVKKYFSITKEELIAALISKQPEPELEPPADGKTSFFKKQTTTKTTIIQKEETHVEEIKTNVIPQNQQTEGQEETKQEETVPPPPPPPASTGEEFHRYIHTYTEGLSEEKLEDIILRATTYIGGDVNNRKTGTVGEMTKNVRKYVREMKSKYNKEY